MCLSAPLTPACSSPAAPSAQEQDLHTHSLQGRFLASSSEVCGQVRCVVMEGVCSSEVCGQVRCVSDTHLASSPPTPHLPQSQRSLQRRWGSCVPSWPSLICSICTEQSAPPAHSGHPLHGLNPPPHSKCTPMAHRFDFFPCLLLFLLSLEVPACFLFLLRRRSFLLLSSSLVSAVLAELLPPEGGAWD